MLLAGLAFTLLRHTHTESGRVGGEHSHTSFVPPTSPFVVAHIVVVSWLPPNVLPCLLYEGRMSCVCFARTTHPQRACVHRNVTHPVSERQCRVAGTRDESSRKKQGPYGGTKIGGGLHLLCSLFWHDSVAHVGERVRAGRSPLPSWPVQRISRSLHRCPFTHGSHFLTRRAHISISLSHCPCGDAGPSRGGGW